MSDWQKIKIGIFSEGRAERCSSFAEFYEKGRVELEKLDKVAEDLDENSDFAAIEKIIDEVEEALEILPSELFEDFQEAKKVLAQARLINWDGSYEGQLNVKHVKFEEIGTKDLIESITAKDIAIYQEMKKAGWDPHLQITPIGLSVNQMVEKLKDPDSGIRTEVHEKLLSSSFIYEPASFDSRIGEAAKTELVSNGGKEWNKVIGENQGWVIDIVPMKERMDADPDILENPAKNMVRNAEQYKRFDQKWRQKGYNGLSVGSYLMASLIAKKRFARNLDRSNGPQDTSITFITETVMPNFTAQQILDTSGIAMTGNNIPLVIMALNSGGQTKIYPHTSDERYKVSRFRPSWRIKLKPRDEQK